MNDPNFDPFATKSSVSNVENSPKSSEESAGQDSVAEAEPELVPELEAEKPKSTSNNFCLSEKFESESEKCEMSPPPLEEVSTTETEDFPPPPAEDLTSDSALTVIDRLHHSDLNSEPVRSKVRRMTDH